MWCHAQLVIHVRDFLWRHQSRWTQFNPFLTAPNGCSALITSNGDMDRWMQCIPPRTKNGSMFSHCTCPYWDLMAAELCIAHPHTKHVFFRHSTATKGKNYFKHKLVSRLKQNIHSTMPAHYATRRSSRCGCKSKRPEVMLIPLLYTQSSFLVVFFFFALFSPPVSIFASSPLFAAAFAFALGFFAFSAALSKALASSTFSLAMSVSLETWRASRQQTGQTQNKDSVFGKGVETWKMWKLNLIFPVAQPVLWCPCSVSTCSCPCSLTPGSGVLLLATSSPRLSGSRSAGRSSQAV